MSRALTGSCRVHLAALGPASEGVPLFGWRLPAGFPNPADDYLEGEIDLARYLIERPTATFLMRVSGQSMSGAGILDGDLVVVETLLHGSALIAGEGLIG